jgi:5,10-methylenetetrahydrofolate reductase
MSSVRELNTKIIAGVILVKSAKMAKYLNDNVPGLIIPDWVTKELESTSPQEQMEAGVRICTQLINEFLPIADGVHVMAIHEEYRLPEIFRHVNI